MAKSRGGRGNAVLTGFRLHRPAAELSARRQILRAGVALEQISRHAVLLMDASATGLGTTYNGHAVSGVWTGPQLRWHTNCLELLAVLLALCRLKGRLRGKDVLVLMDNTATFAYINQLCGYAPVAWRNSPVTSSSGVRSRWGRFLPSTSQESSIRRPTSCREQHFQGSGDSIPRQSSWLELVWSGSGRPVCISRNHPLSGVLLPNRGNARHGFTGTQLAPGPAQICIPPVSLLAQTLCKIREDEEQVLLVAPYWPNRTWFPGTHAPRDSPSLADSSEEGSAFSETGHPLAPQFLGDLPQEVAFTIASPRAPSTRQTYALRWNLFGEWCSSHREDPRRCSIRAMLSFLQQRLERRLPPPPLKVYVAAIPPTMTP